MNSAKLQAGDLNIPPTLMAAIEQRQAAMRVAAEERELADLEAAEAADDAQNGSPIGRFFEGLLPNFLRGDRSAQPAEAGANAAAPAATDEEREKRRARLEELRRRKAEREGVVAPDEEE